MKNTVFRVSAPDTTEGTKRRNAEIAARERERMRPQLRPGNPKAVSAKKARELLKDIMDPRRGQGNEEKPLYDAAEAALLSMGPATASAHLQRLRAVERMAKGMRIPQSHPGWKRLAQATSRAENFATAIDASTLAPVVLAARKSLRENGASGLLDPSTLMLLGSIAGKTAIRRLEANPEKWSPPEGYPRPNLKLAEDMLAARGGRWSKLSREDKMAIRKQTGLQMRKGGGGAWEYLPSGSISLKDSVIAALKDPANVGKSWDLADAIDYSRAPEYVVAYPDFLKGKLIFDKEDGDTLGYHTVRDGTEVIAITPLGADRPAAHINSTINHELAGHGVQQRAGQPPGGSDLTAIISAKSLEDALNPMSYDNMSKLFEATLSEAGGEKSDYLNWLPGFFDKTRMALLPKDRLVDVWHDSLDNNYPLVTGYKRLVELAYAIDRGEFPSFASDFDKSTNLFSVYPEALTAPIEQYSLISKMYDGMSEKERTKRAFKSYAARASKLYADMALQSVSPGGDMYIPDVFAKAPVREYKPEYGSLSSWLGEQLDPYLVRVYDKIKEIVTDGNPLNDDRIKQHLTAQLEELNTTRMKHTGSPTPTLSYSDEVYRRLGGEIGARVMGAMWQLTPEQRASSLIDDYIDEDAKNGPAIDIRTPYKLSESETNIDDALRQAAKGGNTKSTRADTLGGKIKTYQSYTRLTQGGRPIYYNKTTGRTLSQEAYEQLFLKEEGITPQYSVPAIPRKTAEEPVVRKEGLAWLGEALKGDDWESSTKRELLTLGLSTQRGRKIWADTATTAAMLGMVGGGNVLREAIKFGLLDAGGKFFETGDVKDAAKEGAEGAAEMLALGALGKIPRRVWAGAAGAAGAVAVPTGAASVARGIRTALENEAPPGGVRYGNYQTEPWQDLLGTGRNRVPSVAVQQASKGGDNRFDLSKNFLATDKVPESIFGIPIVSRREDYTEEDIAFFREHPEAGGYYDLGDANEEMAPAGGEEVPAQAAEGAGKVYGLRNDGKTFKGSGWLGEFKTSDGGVATEYSTQSDAVKVGGKRIDFPSLVPTLTPDEVKTMTNDIIPNHKAVPESIMQKAVDHALLRIGQGASVWANDGNPPAADRPAYMAQRAIADVIPFIKEHEGFRAKAYKCNAGHWTIGYGQTEINGRAVKPGDTIDEPTAAKWLERRVRDNALYMYRNYKWSRDLSAGALAAAYDVAYNLGVAALGERKSPTLTKDMKTAKDKDSIIWRELGTYVNVGGKPLKGLVNRRNDAEKAWRK